MNNSTHFNQDGKLWTTMNISSTNRLVDLATKIALRAQGVTVFSIGRILHVSRRTLSCSKINIFNSFYGEFLQGFDISLD